MEFGKKAYLLRAVKAARKTLDITSYVQSGFPIKRKIDEKTGLGEFLFKIVFNCVRLSFSQEGRPGDVLSIGFSNLFLVGCGVQF